MGHLWLDRHRHARPGYYRTGPAALRGRFRCEPHHDRSRAFGFGAGANGLNTPLGLLADRRGRRPLPVGGPLVPAIGMAGSGLVPNIAVLIAWRFVSGVGSAMYMTGAKMYLADIAGPDQRARYLGTNQAAVQLGVSIGPAIGGLIAEAFGLRSPFYSVADSAMLAALYAWFRLSETRLDHLAETGRSTNRGAWRALVRTPGFASVSLVAIVVFLTRGPLGGVSSP